jgi:hypothetical protein
MRDVDCRVHILLKALVELLDGGCLFRKVRVRADILQHSASLRVQVLHSEKFPYENNKNEHLHQLR